MSILKIYVIRLFLIILLIFLGKICNYGKERERGKREEGGTAEKERRQVLGNSLSYQDKEERTSERDRRE